MAIVNVNSISGINSITAQSTSLNFYTAAGNTLSIGASVSGNITGNVTGNLTGNVNATGVSTFSGGLLVGTGASISSPATNVLALGTNNTEVVRIDSSGNVGVNTSIPASKLHVQNGAIVKDQYSDQNSANPGLQLKHNGTIYGSWRHDGRLEIGGQDSNAVIRLNPDGTTGIGTNNPSSMLHLLQSSGNAKITIQRSNTASNTDDYGSILWRSSAANNNGAIGVARESAENNGYMYFSTGSGGTLTERARFNSTGAFVLAGGSTSANGIGIAFPATQSASTDANTLDDYEEGTFTPTVFLGSTQQTVGNTTGTYTKIGNTVFFACRMETITKSGTGSLSVRSLPFTPGSVGNENRYSQPTFRWGNINPSGIIVPLINVGGGTSHIVFQIFTTTGGYNGEINDSHCSATYNLYGISGFYTV